MAKRIVYVSCADPREIHSFTQDFLSGALTPLAITSVPGLTAASNSMPMAIGRGGRELHAALRRPPFPLVSFAIDQTDGTLRQIGTASLPHSASYIATDRSGRWLLSASYADAQIAVMPIDEAGAATDPVHQVAAALPKAHSLRTSPDNRFVYAACVGAGAILCWAFDQAHGLQLPVSPRATASHAPQAGPRHIAFNRNGTALYVVNEADGTVDVFARDLATGGLTLHQTVEGLESDAHGEAAAADLHLAPNGEFLYASLRSNSTIAAFRVAASDTTLSLVERVPVEKKPRGFAISPDGRFLICAGRDAAYVGVYAIEASTGRLGRIGGAPTGENANWVEIVDLP